MKKTILATLITAASFGSFNASAEVNANLNRDELKDYAYLETVSPAMAQLVRGLEFGNPEQVQEALSGFDDLSNQEKVVTLTILNNTNINEKTYDSVLDQLVNGGNAVNLTPEQKTAYNDFMAQDKHISGDFYEVKEAVKAEAINRKEGHDIIIDPQDPDNGELQPISDIIVDPIAGEPLDREANIAKFNAMLANQGEGNASIDRDKNGNMQLTFTDQVSGEERKLNLSDMTPEQLKVVKDGMVEYHNNNQSLNQLTLSLTQLTVKSLMIQQQNLLKR
ncbi:hypothetical protein AB4145_08835 [Vibrio splendidus]